MHKLVLILSVLLLSACAMQKMDDGLPHLVGKPTDYAFRILGYPNAETRIAGSKVFIWGNANSYTSMETVTSPYSGTAYGYGGGVSYQGTTSYQVPRTYNYNCTIRLIADQKNIIQSWDWKGNEGGCRYYSDAMDNLMFDAGR